ncbi:acetolactate synthase [Mycobacterium dioxanotrophicus]|uniref:acetolactate synthase n=1 Tax=Mycobacterium dioxanotrophicus TaxID=482462 RepID=A0A1Y0BZ98_9MYCO|nr:thiamine pyrophosphate-binding protein [Mycobacterium dioxanotrophicus]ART68238.1 acetolactate synthase [Mycobacterium dioxanotrophicus]
MPVLTGGQIIARTLKNYGIEHCAGIPGHGIWSVTDAFLDEESKIPFIQVFHEQSALHLADGYYRVTGKPMLALTSIGAGASNTVLGLATALQDSVNMLLITGGPPTHMRGHGLLQVLDRFRDNDFPRIAEALTKRSWVANTVEELPFALHRLFNTMLTGRPGPVHLEVPMDVQAASADVELHDLEARIPTGVTYPDPTAIAKAVDVMKTAERPVIVLGGGAIASNASPELIKLAEKWNAAVVTTWNGKGAFPEDHPLSMGAIGHTGTSAGNATSSKADVILSVGCRFTDWTSSSFAKGVTYSIPDTKLVHVDIDPQEIGRNYPVDVGIVADARVTAAALLEALTEAPERAEYTAELESLKAEWEATLATRRDSDRFPFTSQRPVGILREIFPRDGIIVSGSGNTQGAVRQTFPVYEPRTHLTSGGFSPMGWAVPAAVGAKLAKPGVPVVCILGDGDFLMNSQEIALSVIQQLPVIFLVQNNAGYMSIRGGMRKQTSRFIGCEFTGPDGNPYSPDFAALGEAYGLSSIRVGSSSELEAALRKAIDANEPTLIEIPTDRDAAGPWTPGWWDWPIPTYVTDERADQYASTKKSEQHY